MDPRDRNELAWLLTLLLSSESPDLTLTLSLLTTLLLLLLLLRLL